MTEWTGVGCSSRLGLSKVGQCWSKETVNPQTKSRLIVLARALSSLLFLSSPLFQPFVPTFLFRPSHQHIDATMPRAKSVKPEAAPKPEADLQQITVDKGEFTRTRDAVRFFS